MYCKQKADLLRQNGFSKKKTLLVINVKKGMGIWHMFVWIGQKKTKILFHEPKVKPDVSFTSRYYIVYCIQLTT